MCIRIALLFVVFLIGVSPALAVDVPAVNETIWPSQNDVAQTTGEGKKLLENQWAKPFTRFSINNFTLSGFVVPSSSGTLTISIPSGTAYLAGRHVTIPAATTVTATASATNYVWLKLIRDGANLVTGAVFQVSTSATPPTDATPIGTLIAGASTITDTTDLRVFPTTIVFLTSGTGWVVPAGVFEVFVEVYGAGGGGGGASGASAGTDGGAGGSTSFSSLSATGGGGGADSETLGGTGAGDGTGSGGAYNFSGKGMPGGRGGRPGEVTAGGAFGERGFDGGAGGYAAGYVTVTPGGTATYAIGAAGGGGNGGASGGIDGGPGQAGTAGRIVISIP